MAAGAAGRADWCSNNFGESLGTTCEDAGQRSAQSSVDNCHRDQAVTNARQLADLLSGADAAVVNPTG
jgi:hypothetical protein